MPGPDAKRVSDIRHIEIIRNDAVISKKVYITFFLSSANGIRHSSILPKRKAAEEYVNSFGIDSTNLVSN
jgi:hypothetical protein